MPKHKIHFVILLLTCVPGQFSVSLTGIKKHHNCLIIKDESKNCTDEAKNYLRSNFMEYYNSNEYHELNPTMLNELINHDDVLVDDEMTIWKILENYVEVKEMPIIKNELVQMVRWQHIPLKVIVENVIDYFDSCDHCREIVDAAILWHISPEERSTNVKKDLFKTKDRKTLCMYMNKTEIYEYHLQLHNPIFNVRVKNRLNITKRFYGVGFLDNQLVIVGGKSQANTIESTVESYDIITGKMTRIDNMIFKRENMAVVTHSTNNDTYLYVIGGNDENGPLNSVERFDRSTLNWTTVTNMIHNRSACSAVLYDSKIYVVGGIDENNILNSLEVFDILNNNWEELEPMKEARANAGFVSTKLYMYVFGGFNGQRIPINSIEYYTNTINRWTNIEAVLKIKGRMIALNFQDDIVIIQSSYRNITTQKFSETKKTVTEPDYFYSNYNFYLYP